MSNKFNLSDEDVTELEDSQQVYFSQNKAESVDSALSSTGSFHIDPNAAPLKVGSVINKRFELTLEIGEGGMGTVYQAIDRVSQEAEARNYYVAVKVLRPELSLDKQLFQLLHREFERTKRLVHKNIIDVHDFDRDRELGCIYMTMEYLTGQTLSQLIKKAAPYTLQSAWSIIEEIGQGLSFAHKNNIVHRDIKPGNVFITDEGIAKILDFGIASKINEQENDKTKISGHNLGGLTVTYASPEMLKDFPPDPSDDIYAFGCVIYELLTGKKFYNQKITEPESIKGLAGRQMQALTKSLASTRSKRTKSIDELLENLKPSKTHFDFLAFVKRKYVITGFGVAMCTVVATVLLLNKNSEESVPKISKSSFTTSENDKVIKEQIVTIDTIAPEITVNKINQASVINKKNFETTDNKFVFSGETEANATIKITLYDATNVVVLERSIAGGEGSWALDYSDVELPVGKYKLTALATDRAGNENVTEKNITISSLKPSPNILEVKLRLSKPSYHIGDTLLFHFKVPKPMYVKIVHRDMNGAVSALPQSAQLLKAGVEYQFPPKGAKFNLKVQGPVGQDSITLVGSEKIISNKMKFLNGDGAISQNIQNDDFSSTQISYDVLK